MICKILTHIPKISLLRSNLIERKSKENNPSGAYLRTFFAFLPTLTHHLRVSSHKKSTIAIAVVLFLWRRESQKRTLPCPARRGFAFAARRSASSLVRRRACESSNPHADWNTPLYKKGSTDEQKAPNRVPFLRGGESQKGTLPCSARRGFAFEPNAVGEFAHQRRGEKSSNPQADWNTPLFIKRGVQMNKRHPIGCLFCVAEREPKGNTALPGKARVRI